MSKLIQTIEFNRNYTKLHGQTHGLLLACVEHISGELILNHFPDFSDFDCKDDSGVHPMIEKGMDYMLLLFEGEKQIMFPTFRKQNAENVEKYADSIGQLFKVEVKTKEQ